MTEPQQEFEAVIEQMKRKAAEQLALGAALVARNSQRLASDVDVETRALLKYLNEGNDPSDSPDQVFQRLAWSVAEAFPTIPSDDEIIKNSATPDLMRYLIAALKAYDGKTTNLATAFKAKLPKGHPGDLVLLKEVLIEAGVSAVEKAMAKGATREAAMDAGEDSAYEVFIRQKRHKSMQEPKKERESRKAIRLLLDDYLWG